jgi:chitodextrinase
MVQYQFDFDASGSHYYTVWTSLVASGESVNITRHWFVPAGTYVVKVRARDQHGLMNGWSDGLTVTVAFNQVPFVPGVPSGPVSVVAGSVVKYFVSTSDPDGDMVQYQFDFDASGSHYYTVWTSLVVSGESVNITRHWYVPAGTYVVKVRARDQYGLMSGWSNGLTVVVSA